MQYAVSREPESPGVAETIHSKAFFGNFLLTLPFLILYWVNLAHHTLFFDEINAWGISAASPNLSTLFHYVHYEGHPWLWYFLLWIPSRFTHDPRGMLWVVAPVGTAIYLIIGLLSPFTKLQKVLIFLSYFVAFEYTVMNRMYGVMFLLALIYVWRRMRHRDAIVSNVLLLAFMANTDMTGVLLSGALLLEYAYDRWTFHAQSGWTQAAKRNAVAAIVIYFGLLAFSIHTLIPARDISWQASGRIGAQTLHPKHLVRAVSNMTAAPWWPISREFPRRFWETDLEQNHKLLYLVPFVLLAYWQIFKRDKNLLLLMGLTLGFGVLFADVVYPGHVRHWGIAYISFLLALWMQRIRRANEGQPNAWSTYAYGLMTLGVVAGILAIASTWLHPFSNAQKTAEWIQKNEPANVPLVGLPDVSFTTVAEELKRPVYFLECQCFDTFKLFSRQRDLYPEEQLSGRLAIARKDLKTKQLLLVSYRPLTNTDLEALALNSFSAHELARFVDGDVWTDVHYIYQISTI